MVAMVWVCRQGAMTDVFSFHSLNVLGRMDGDAGWVAWKCGMNLYNLLVWLCWMAEASVPWGRLKFSVHHEHVELADNYSFYSSRTESYFLFSRVESCL